MKLLLIALAVLFTACQSPQLDSKTSRSGFKEPRRVFIGAPLLVEENEGKPTWTLQRDLTYQTNEGFQIVAKSGFVTDFASIPRPVWSIWPPYQPSYGRAAVIHDWLYRYHGRLWNRTLTRKESDQVFLCAMKDLDAGYFQRHTIYNAVRTFGGSSWK